MKTEQTAPLIWVHIICNGGSLRRYADEKADNKSRDWRENGYHVTCISRNPIIEYWLFRM